MPILLALQLCPYVLVLIDLIVLPVSPLPLTGRTRRLCYRDRFWDGQVGRQARGEADRSKGRSVGLDELGTSEVHPGRLSDSMRSGGERYLVAGKAYVCKSDSYDDSMGHVHTMGHEQERRDIKQEG